MENNKTATSTINSSKDSSSEYDIPIGDGYKLYAKKKLGSGAFGDIYWGTNIKLNEDIAIKLESCKTKHPQLFAESKMYIALQGGGKNINIIF